MGSSTQCSSDQSIYHRCGFYSRWLNNKPHAQILASYPGLPMFFNTHKKNPKGEEKSTQKGLVNFVTMYLSQFEEPGNTHLLAHVIDSDHH